MTVSFRYAAPVTVATSPCSWPPTPLATSAMTPPWSSTPTALPSSSLDATQPQRCYVSHAILSPIVMSRTSLSLCRWRCGTSPAEFNTILPRPMNCLDLVLTMTCFKCSHGRILVLPQLGQPHQCGMSSKPHIQVKLLASHYQIFLLCLHLLTPAIPMWLVHPRQEWGPHAEEKKTSTDFIGLRRHCIVFIVIFKVWDTRYPGEEDLKRENSTTPPPGWAAKKTEQLKWCRGRLYIHVTPAIPNPHVFHQYQSLCSVVSLSCTFLVIIHTLSTPWCLIPLRCSLSVLRQIYFDCQKCQIQALTTTWYWLSWKTGRRVVFCWDGDVFVKRVS